MAKKKAGLAAFDKDITDARFKSLGNDLMRSHYDQLSAQLETFQQALAAFASQHAKDIRANPAFRAQFAQMCSTIGIDPLRSVGPTGKAGKFSEVLGIGEIYHELSVQIIEICRRTRSENGGLICVSSVCKIINDRSRKFGGTEVQEDDIFRAVRSLKVLESGFEIVDVGSVKMIRSVPQELNTDQSTVLETAQISGYVSESLLRLNFKWERARARAVLEDLLSAGLLWIDDQGEEKEYWLASSMSNN